MTQNQDPDMVSNGSTSIPNRRRRGKSSAVVTQIRDQIIRGLQPAARLATFNEMEQVYGVSRAVLRDAVEELKRDGFIYSVDRQGLFVSDRPPHLSRFGMVFPNNPSSPEWPRFYTALQHEAVGLQRDRGDITFSAYHDLSAGPGSDSYERLCADVESHLLAGLILMPGCHQLGNDPNFCGVEVPKIYICGAPNVGRVPSVAMDEIQLCDRMVQWLRERGRKRIAAVAIWGNSEMQRNYLLEKNVPHRPHWVQTLGRDNVPDVRKIIALLMDYPKDQRPDGLIILDDNLTEHAIGGLLECDLKVGTDIDVIAHCNWPWTVANSVPVQRVGFHARHMLSLALRAIEMKRTNKPLAREIVKVPALFEAEIDKPWPAIGFDE